MPQKRRKTSCLGQLSPEPAVLLQLETGHVAGAKPPAPLLVFPSPGSNLHGPKLPTIEEFRAQPIPCARYNRNLPRSAYKAKARSALGYMCDECRDLTKGDERFSKYGITREEYDDLLEQQRNRCAICYRFGHARSLVIDQCHGSGRVCGLLCHSCNTGLGKLGDNLQGLLRAVEYLKAGEAQ